MAYPTPYSPSTNFTDLAASLGIPRDKLDIEFMALAQFCAGILKNVQGIQRSDGALQNSVVTIDALSPSVKASIAGGWTPKGQWMGPGVKYEEGDYVEDDDVGYVAVVDHVSGADFSADRLAGKWQSGFALSILQTEPEINTYAATSGQTNFTLNSQIGSTDAILVWVNSELTPDFTTSGNDVVLDTPAAIADEIVVVHFRVVDASLVNTLFQARDEAEASAVAAAASEANAALSEAAAALSEAAAALSETNASASETAAAASEGAAAVSEGAAAASAQLAASESINASLAEDNVVRRILPGRFDSFALAAASPYAEDGAFFVLSTDGGIYYFNTVSPLDVRAFTGLNAQQTANIAAIADMKAALNRFDGSQTSGGVADAYTLTSPAGQELDAYYDGLRVSFIVTAVNTGASTLNVDGVGAVALRKRGGAALRAGELAANMIVDAVYANSVFQITSLVANSNLVAFEALNAVADRFPYHTGPNSMSLAAVTAFARSLMDDTSASAMRTTLGLGLLATLNTITSAQFDDILTEAKGGTGFASLVAALNNANALRIYSVTLAQLAGHIAVQWGGFTFAIAWGRASVGGDSSVPATMSLSMAGVYASIAGVVGNADTGASDHVYANWAGGNTMTLTNGVGSTRTVNYIAVGVPS